MTWAISPGSMTSQLCLVTGRVMPVASVSWKASPPMDHRGTCPVTATTGTESMYEDARPVTRLVAPGPEVAMHTPTRPEAWAYPSAAWAAPCSWRARMWGIGEASRGGEAGRVGPPGRPGVWFV